LTTSTTTAPPKGHANSGASPNSATNTFTNPPANSSNSKLDAIALQTYRFKPDDDLLEKLLTLNLELAEKKSRENPS